jgi:molybdopterin converting factor small subunit
MAQVRLRYWAALKAAAGVSELFVEASTLADALDAARAAHGDTPDFSKVLRICSVVIDDVPVGLRNHNEVAFAGGAVIDLLPPFAGG